MPSLKDQIRVQILKDQIVSNIDVNAGMELQPNVAGLFGAGGVQNALPDTSADVMSAMGAVPDSFATTPEPATTGVNMLPGTQTENIRPIGPGPTIGDTITKRLKGVAGFFEKLPEKIPTGLPKRDRRGYLGMETKNLKEFMTDFHKAGQKLIMDNPEGNVLKQIYNGLVGGVQLIGGIPQFFASDLPAMATKSLIPGEEGLGAMGKQMTMDTAKVIAFTMLKQINPEEYERFRKMPEGQEIEKMINEDPLRPLMAPMIFSGMAKKGAKMAGAFATKMKVRGVRGKLGETLKGAMDFEKARPQPTFKEMIRDTKAQKLPVPIDPKLGKVPDVSRQSAVDRALGLIDDISKKGSEKPVVTSKESMGATSKKRAVVQEGATVPAERGVTAKGKGFKFAPERPMQKAKDIGEARSVMGTDAILAKTERIDGVDYELYNANSPKDKSGFLRVFDAESGKTVTLEKYPIYSNAEIAYNKAVPAETAVTPKGKGGEELIDLNNTPVKTNADGTITLFHRTTPEKAAELRKTGEFKSLENKNETFFSNKSEGQAKGFGDAVIEVKVKPSDISLNDAFRDGEVHVTVSNKSLSKKSIVATQAKPAEAPKATPKEAVGETVSNVPIENIKTDVDRFQNRKTEFSEETAQAVAERYDANKFDPVVLWKDPKTGESYVLSGHSRLEGLKRRGETDIPARYFKGTEVEAGNFATIEANRLTAKESLGESVTAYQKAKKQGYTKSKLKDLFGSDLNTLESIQHLDTKGKFMDILGQTNITTEFPFIKRFATWTGELRKGYKDKLTNRHESQLFDFLYKEGRKNIDIAKDDFYNLVRKNVDRMDWKKDQPLVLKRSSTPLTGTRATANTAKIEAKIDQLKQLKKEVKTVAEIERIDKDIAKLQAGIKDIVNRQGTIFDESGAVLDIIDEIRNPAGAKRVPYKEAIKTPDRPEMSSMENYYKTIAAPEGILNPITFEQFVKSKGGKWPLKESHPRYPELRAEFAQTKQQLSLDRAEKSGIALRQTKGGKIKPAVRESGTFVSSEFASYDKFKDAKQGIGGGTKDFIRFVQEIDGALTPQQKAKRGKRGGPAEEAILRRTEDIVKLELNWSAEQSLRIQKVVEGLNKKQRKLVTEVLEETTRKGAFVETADFANNANIKKITSDPKIVKAAQEARKLLEYMLAEQNRLRALRGQDLINYREYYAPHILREASLWERTFNKQFEPKEVMKGPQLPDYIKPNKPFNPRELAREFGMKDYMREMQIDKILEDYANTASRDIHHTSIIQNNKAFIQQLETMGYKNAAEGISNFTAEGFGGVKARLDRALNLPIGVQKGMRTWRGALMRSVFPANFSWNTLVQTLSSALTVMRGGITNSSRGMVDWFANPTLRNKMKTAYSYRVKAQRAGRITQQDINTGVTNMISGKRSKWQAAIDGANFLTELIERELTGWSIATGLRHGAKRGLKGNALWDYASDMGAKTQSMYNMENKPGMLRSEFVQTMAPFNTFVFEMYNTAKEFAGKTGTPPAAMTERIGWVLRFTAMAYAGNYIANAVIGRKPWDMYSFIPFSDQTIKPMVDAIRGKDFGSTSTRALPSPVGAGVEFWRGVRSYLKTGNSRKLRNWGIKYMTAFAGVPGGTQMARTVDGWLAVADGGMKSPKGKTLFRISDPWEKARAVTLGPWRTKAGIEYWDKRETSLFEDLGITKKKKKTPLSIQFNDLDYSGGGPGKRSKKKKRKKKKPSNDLGYSGGR